MREPFNVPPAQLKGLTPAMILHLYGHAVDEDGRLISDGAAGANDAHALVRARLIEQLIRDRVPQYLWQREIDATLAMVRTGGRGD